MDSGKMTESQGQRLSTYASSSSYNHDSKNSPKTPKKSSTATTSDKISSRSSSKDESVSPHHLLSEFNGYTGTNPPLAKENHSECILKCTCKHSSYTSLRSPKQHMHCTTSTSSTYYEKNIQKISKISCDAATSPNRFSQRSPHTNPRLNSNNGSKNCNELRISDEKAITAKTTVSPRRLIATRNAATSPGLDKRKLGPKCDTQLKSPEVTVKTVLEKANSLGESKPPRTLRTTRSLSPRPPVRHQHAITVCDENDIISVKISPSDDFEDELSEVKFGKKKYKAQSEQTSPNLSDLGTTFTYETRSNNKSTGCLVYVPSDPWMKMTESDEPKKSDKKRGGKLTSEVRSLSRGNLLPLNDDPWIWRNSSKPTPVKAKSPKQEVFRQAKSFSATKFELNDLSKSLTAGQKSEKNSSAKNSNRPKLQRCKSPIVMEDELSQFVSESSRTCTCNASANSIVTENKMQQNLLSPRKDTVPKEASTVNQNSTSTVNGVGAQPSKNFLNVTNPNLMQSRHSFSSISQKDDELQLNIRRLSEQIKNPINSNAVSGNSTGGGGADFSDYLKQFRTAEAQKAKAAAASMPTRSSSKNIADTVLETTC